MTRPGDNQQKEKKRTCLIMDVAVSVNDRVKVKESEKETST